MTGIAIFMEGGGKGDTRATLRRGMDSFLRAAKDAARRKSMRWRLVACGSRNKAYEQFTEAVERKRGDILFLLVDAEEGVKADPRSHLLARDNWTRLKDVEEERIHLMVRTMETWLVADAEALRTYYGPRFKANRLPRRENLEAVPKVAVNSALARATESTGQGSYHKIRHASDLLAVIDAEKVQARCLHCERLFNALFSVIQAA